jgi:hypothetical protein
VLQDLSEPVEVILFSFGFYRPLCVSWFCRISSFCNLDFDYSLNVSVPRTTWKAGWMGDEYNGRQADLTSEQALRYSSRRTGGAFY